MFKKTKVRSILELLGKDLSGREVSKVLGVSRNTVAEVQSLFEASGKSWDDIASLDDDRLYDLFYPDKFKYKMNGMKGLVVARRLIPLWIESFIMLMKYQQVRQT